jgi:hypothetical protein
MEDVVMEGLGFDPRCQAANIRVVPEPSLVAREIVRKASLAQAVLGLLHFALPPAFLEKLYDEQRGQCYHDLLSFSTLVHVISSALLQYRGSARPAIDQARKNNELPCQSRAVYDKLRRLPLNLSIAFLWQATAALRPLVPKSLADPLPACFAEFTVGILDGKKIKNVAKKLLVARGQAGKLLGSMFLAWYDPVARMIAGIEVDRDGEANENRLVEKLLARAHAQTSLSRLWVCDALYCDLVQMSLHQRYGNHFVLRYHPKLSFTADEQRPAEELYDEANQRRLRQEWGWVGAVTDPRRTYVRRVHWLRDGDQAPLIVVTDLSDSQRYPAAAVLALYLHRWQIETVFQEITELFQLRKLIGCAPEAVTFQAAFCMVLYNMVQLVKAYVAEVGPAEPMSIEDVSTKMMFNDMSRELNIVVWTIPPIELTALIQTPSSPEAMRQWLAKLLQGRWETLWRKARNKTKRKYGPKPKGKSGHSGHTSVHRLQQKHAQLQRKKTSPLEGGT